MSTQMIALNRQPGVRLVGVKELWQHIFSKTVLKATGPESTMEYQDGHLCAGIKAGVDGAIHGVQDL